MKDEVLRHKEIVIDKREKQVERLTKALNKKEEENNLLKKEATNKTELLQEAQGNNLKLQKELDIKNALIVNYKNNQEFKCDQCGWKTHNKKSLTGHMTSHVTAVKRPELLKCTDCDFTSKDNTSMTGHMTNHHPVDNSPRLLKCTECDFTSKNIQSFNSHIEAHKNMFNCGETVGDGDLKCMVMFKTEQELNNHIKISHSQSKFKCNNCEKSFATHNSLMQHAKTKHEDSPRLPVGHQAWNRQQESANFCCEICPAVFILEADLRAHARIHIMDIPCNQCEEMFETKKDLSHHVRTKHGDFITKRKVCRYFQQGRCFNPSCKFSHEEMGNTTQQHQQMSQPKTCRRGPRCEFFARGTCYYFHAGFRRHQQGFGGQEQEQFRRWDQEPEESRRWDQGQYKPRRWGKEQFRSQEEKGQSIREGQQWEIKPCHFQETCWYPDTCRFSHQNFLMEKEFLENI